MSQIPLEAENEFYAAMEREDAEQLEREARAAASARLNALALQLKREFSTAESSRRLIEERWLEDLMQYRGQYPADVMERLKKFKRSQVYYRMTTNKVDMMVARLMDLLFPARSKNWAIQPTPDPEIPGELVEQSPEFMQAVQEVMAEQMQLLQAQNAVPDDLAMRKMRQMAMQEAMRRIDLDTIKLRIAKACADKMEQVIDDQLKESSAGGEFRPSWQQHCKAVIFSSCLLGMGVLKGPLVERRELRKRRPVSDASGRVVWDEQVMGEEIRPYYEAVPVWEVYPDPGALEPRQLRYVWQVHLKTDKDLWDLMTFPGFDASAIEGYLKDHENGDASLTTYESQKRNLNDANGNLGAVMDKRFRVGKGYLIGKRTDLAATLGVGPLVDRVRDILATAGQEPVLVAVPVRGQTMGYFSAPVVHGGSGAAPEMTVSGVPQKNADIVILVTTPGVIGTATVEISTDGGTTYGEAQTSAEQMTIGSGEDATGATVLFAASAKLEEGSSYRFVARTAIGPVSRVGDAASPLIEVSGSVLAGVELVVQIVKGGARNAGTYRLSTDGGDNFGKARTIPFNGTVTLDEGPTVTFPEGSYVDGVTYSCRILPPQPSIVDVMSALESPLALYDVEFVHVVGPSDSVDWAAARATRFPSTGGRCGRKNTTR